MAKARRSNAQESDEFLREEQAPVCMKVKEGALSVRIRAGAGIDTPHVDGKYLGKGVHIIDEVKEGPGSKSGWGHLSTGEGWVCLDYVEIVN